MRILVMFDLPVITDTDRREYRKFRKFFDFKMDSSCFRNLYTVKLHRNSVVADGIVENIKKNKPQAGLVQMLKVTEKQYSKMEYIVGESKSEVLDGDERLIIL